MAHEAAREFFRLLCERYEGGSIVLMSNKRFSEWSEYRLEERRALGFSTTAKAREGAALTRQTGRGLIAACTAAIQAAPPEPTIWRPYPPRGCERQRMPLPRRRRHAS
ncbi:MAG: hypothetical protein ACP5O6_00965 [Candidatus Baltobacteraceae bacterium]